MSTVMFALEALTAALDGDAFHTGFGIFVAENQWTLLQLRGILKKRQEGKNRRWVRHDAAIVRNSSGEQVRIGE